MIAAGPGATGPAACIRFFTPTFWKKWKCLCRLRRKIPFPCFLFRLSHKLYTIHLGFHEIDGIHKMDWLLTRHFSFRGINYLQIWWTCLGNVPPSGDPHGIKNFPRHVQWTCLGKIKRLMGPRNHEIYFPDMFIEHVWENHLHCTMGAPPILHFWEKRPKKVQNNYWHVMGV